MLTKVAYFKIITYKKTTWFLEYERKVNVYKMYERLYKNVRGRKQKLNSS